MGRSSVTTLGQNGMGVREEIFSLAHFVLGPGKAIPTEETMNLRPVLLIYTSHRIDCLKLCLNCVEKNTNIGTFKKIYIIANNVSLPHLLLASEFCKRHTNAQLVTCSPRGLVPAVMTAVNQIIDLHKDDIFVKLDEDVFVPSGWLEALSECYFAHKDRDDIFMSAGLCPISSSVYHSYILPVVESRLPDLHKKYKSASINFDANKYLHRYVWDGIINRQLEQEFENFHSEKYLYVDSITINCIVMDHKVISEVYPFPTDKDPETGFACVDELAINRSLKGRRVALPKQPFIHHYSHWRSESYLRRHVPVSRVRDFVLNLDCIESGIAS